MVTEKRRGGYECWPTVGNRAVAAGEGVSPAYALRPHHHVVIIIRVRADTSQVAQGWVGDTPTNRAP
jgi:hypothetical protein